MCGYVQLGRFFTVLFFINAQNGDGKTEFSGSIISKSFGSFLYNWK
jgi:hypothetical protein